MRPAPWPPGALVGGAFAPLAERQLDDGSLVFWFRRQLGLRRPVVPGATEADLLLVLAAGLWAARLPPAQVRRSRVAAFADTVRHGRWFRAAGRLAAARALLDRVLAARPAALRGPPSGAETSLPEAAL